VKKGMVIYTNFAASSKIAARYCTSILELAPCCRLQYANMCKLPGNFGIAVNMSGVWHSEVV
jgi:hypothetical protein